MQTESPSLVQLHRYSNADCERLSTPTLSPQLSGEVQDLVDSAPATPKVLSPAPPSGPPPANAARRSLSVSRSGPPGGAFSPGGRAPPEDMQRSGSLPPLGGSSVSAPRALRASPLGAPSDSGWEGQAGSGLLQRSASKVGGRRASLSDTPTAAMVPVDGTPEGKGGGVQLPGLSPGFGGARGGKSPLPMQQSAPGSGQFGRAARSR